MSKFGELVRTYREVNNLSQGDISKKLKLTSSQYISNVERGVAVSSAMALKFAKILGFSRQEIFEALTADDINNRRKELKL